MSLSQRRQDEIREWFRRHWQEEVAFSRLCGFEVVEFTPEVVRVRAAFRPELSAHEKIFHGGVLATLIDTTGSGAVIAGHDYSLGTRLTTVAMSVQYLSGAPGEDIVVAEGLYHRRAGLREGRRLFDELISLHLPVVAAVNGPAVGLGCTVATACDIVFMAQDAFFADPHVTVALVAGDGGAVTWPVLTSLLKAKQYLLTGDRMPAREALAIGMANFVVPGDELMDAATAFARRLASLPPQAVQDTKLVLNQILRERASILPFGLAAESQSSDTVEYAEAPAKFEAERAARRGKAGS